MYIPLYILCYNYSDRLLCLCLPTQCLLGQWPVSLRFTVTPLSPDIQHTCLAAFFPADELSTEPYLPMRIDYKIVL